MLAIVLVGGLGTRLHPLTLTVPKQMLPVAGRPMIEHVVSGLGRHGVDRVVLALGYRDDAFHAAYPDGCCAGVSLECAVEPEPLGTAGAIRFAWRASDRPDETFLVVNGDVITALDITELLRLHRAVRAEATMHLTGVDDPSRYGVAETDADGRVRDFIEKPAPEEAPGNWVNAGTYAMEPSVIDRIPDKGKVSVEDEVFPGMAAEGVLWAMPDSAYWIDAGTPDSYLQAQLDILEGRYSAQVEGEVLYTAPSASIGTGARLERSVVMSGVSIGTGARLERSVVMSGVSIGAGAAVSDSVIGPSASVGTGTVVCDGSLVAAGAAVEADTELKAHRSQSAA